MGFDLYKLYPGLIVGTADTLNPISDIIDISERRRIELNNKISTHIQIAFRRNDLNKVVGMNWPEGINEADASEDEEGLFGRAGHHIVFIAAPVAEDDYDAQDRSNALIREYLKLRFKYALPELFNWWGFNYNETPREHICSTLQRQWCMDMGLPYANVKLYSPLTVQIFYQMTKKMIYTCYEGNICLI